MSDGPWKTLNMSRSWRLVARSAEMAASSSDEVAQNIRQALVDDLRDIPPKMLAALRKAFEGEQQSCLPLNDHDKFVRLRSLVDGSPLEALLASHAAMVADEGLQGADALREVVIRTVMERAAYGARQVEEHHHRVSDDGCASSIRDLIETSARLIDLVALSNQILGKNAAPTRRSGPTFTGLDDGPRLRS
jgi:hypothetical protein